MPSGPWSTATARVSPSTPAFAVAYGRAPRTGRRAWCDDTLTMAPGRAWPTKWFTAVWQPTTAGARFAVTSASTRSAEATSRAASSKTAALFTQPVNGAASSARCAASRTAPGSAASPVTRTMPGCSRSSRRATSSTTTGPAAASRSATARPMPPAPPVTTLEVRGGPWRSVTRSLDGGRREGVALVEVAGLEALEEPALTGLGGAVRPALGVDPALGGLLDAVVAHCGGRGEGVLDVLGRQRLEEGRAGVLVLRGRGVLGPHTAEAVGHQLGAHGAGVGPLRVLLGAIEQAELVLERVPVLVGDHVLLRERPTAGTDLVLEDLEEAGVDVHLLVEGAVERADLVARGPARRLGAAVVEHRLRRLPLLAVPRHLAGPVGLHRIHRADDAALGVLVGVGAGLALLERLGVLVAGRGNLAGVEAARPAGGVAVPSEDPVEEQGEDQDDDAADAAAHDHATRRTATSTAGADL